MAFRHNFLAVWLQFAKQPTLPVVIPGLTLTMRTMLFSPRRIVQSNSCFSAVMYNPLEEKFTPDTLLSRPSSDFSTLLLAPVAIKRCGTEPGLWSTPAKSVASLSERNQCGVQCESYLYWIHTRCTGISKEEYSELQQSTDPWFYVKCTHDLSMTFPVRTPRFLMLSLMLLPLSATI